MGNIPAPRKDVYQGAIIMNEIKLDPKKLLGFKIIADGPAAKLSSPKIGTKDCTVHDDSTPVAANFQAQRDRQ